MWIIPWYILALKFKSNAANPLSSEIYKCQYVIQGSMVTSDHEMFEK